MSEDVTVEVDIIAPLVSVAVQPINVTVDVVGSPGPAGAAGPAGPGHTILDEGVARAARGGLNFVGAGVTATDDAANNRTVVTIPGGGASSSIIEGTWSFTTASNTEEPLYAVGYIWNKVSSPGYTQRYMIAAVDKNGVDHTSQFAAVVPGDELQLTWANGNNGRRVIRSVKNGYSGGSVFTHLILGTAGRINGDAVPGGPGGSGNPIQAAIIPNRRFTHGTYLLDTGTNTIAPRGHLSWDANPQSAPASVTQLAISEYDLAGMGSSLQWFAAPVGTTIRIHLDQGGLITFTTTGPLSSLVFDGTNGSYFTLPVKTTSSTGYFGTFGWVEVVPPVDPPGLIRSTVTQVGVPSSVVTVADLSSSTYDSGVTKTGGVISIQKTGFWAMGLSCSTSNTVGGTGGYIEINAGGTPWRDTQPAGAQRFAIGGTHYLQVGHNVQVNLYHTNPAALNFNGVFAMRWIGEHDGIPPKRVLFR